MIIKDNYLKLETLCRLCLQPTGQGPDHHLIQGDNNRILKRCTGVTVTPPLNRICIICLNYLNDMDTFRKRCRLINTLLLDYTNQDTFEPLTHIKEEEEIVIEVDPVIKQEEEEKDKTEKIVDIQSKEGKFSCNICGKTLSNIYNLKSHIKHVHDENKSENTGRRKLDSLGKYKYQCDECNYSTPYSQSLTYHRRVHSGERPYSCKHCSKTFTQPSSLICHEKRHSDTTYFTCPECGKQFKLKDAYEKHKKVHSDIRPYVCPLCNKGLKSKQTFEGHMNRHNNVRNYSCETCGNCFVTLVELINHSKKHSGDKNYQCDKCPFKTYARKGLEAHTRRHTGERPFKCELCDLSCYTQGELKIHMRKHTKEKNYSCPVCEVRFIHSSSVNKHMLKSHGIKYAINKNVDRRTVK